MRVPHRTARHKAAYAIDLRQRRAWFEDDTSDTSSSPTTQTTTETEGTLTQAEVNKLVGKTRTEASARAKQEATAAILQQLGVEKLEDAESILKAAREKADAEKSELERLTSTLDKEKAAREQMEQAFASYKAEVEQRERLARRDHAVKAALSAATTKADKVLALLQVQHADALAAVLDDEGAVNDKRVTELVEAARKAYPEDFGARGVGSPSTSGGRVPGNTFDEAARQENFRRMRRGH